MAVLNQSRKTPGVLAFGLFAAAVVAGPALARVEMTQDEALRLAFPPPHAIERRTLYIDDAQAKQAGDAAGVPIEARAVPYYVGRSEGVIVAIDIVAFDEPHEYRVTTRWLDQFRGRNAAEAPRLPGAIRSLGGATLSARAVTDAARRVLALHRLFVQPPDTRPATTP
jgi:hypothetical protein